MAAGYKDWTAGATLAAADLEDYLQLQSIMRFASATERDTALSAVLTEGLYAYLIDVNTLIVYTGSAWSTIGPMHGGLLTWTPAVVQSGSVTVTNTYSVYSRVGRMVTAWFNVDVTGSGTAANNITVSLPVNANSTDTDSIIGRAMIFDASATLRYKGDAAIANAATFAIFAEGTANAYYGSSGFTAGLAVGDVISGCIIYEAAADA